MTVAAAMPMVIGSVRASRAKGTAAARSKTCTRDDDRMQDPFDARVLHLAPYEVDEQNYQRRRQPIRLVRRAPLRRVATGLHDELTGEAYAVIDGTDSRAHDVRFRGIEAFADAPAAGGIVEVRRVGGADDPRPTLVLANRSDIDLERQVTTPGATWLDYRLVERQHLPLATGGFGQEVHDAMAARVEHLAAEGLARRQGPNIVPQPNLLATLRRRELDVAGARLSAETGLAYTPAAGGEMVAGTYRQRLSLTSDRFAMIDTDLGFALVPWTPALDRHLGRHVTGVAKESGGIEWSFGCKRGLEI
jgi:Protein of unknown function (DUF3363)